MQPRLSCRSNPNINDAVAPTVPLQSNISIAAAPVVPLQSKYKKRGRFRALLAGLFWALLAAGQASAMTDYEFLSLCAGERGRIVPQTLKKALTDGANINFTGPRGLTPLMAFVSAHREADREALAALRILLAAGPDLEVRSEEGGTALGYAILNQAGPRVIAALLAAGADVRTPIGPKDGLPPLGLAAGLEPNPLVSALLLAGGADRELRAARKELLAQAGRQPGVLRLLSGALEADEEEGLPLFTAAPADQDLRARLKELDARLKPPRDAEEAWLGYLQWQIDLPLNLAARRDLFGRTETEAWLDEYAFRLASADPGPDPRPRDRIILPGPRPIGAALEALAVADRQVAVLVYAGNLLVAYETASGRELWRRRPSGPTQILPVGRLLLAATAWGGGLGEAVVLEPLTGAVLLTLPDLDDPKWIVDAGRRALIISTDFTLDILDLGSWKNRSWSWRTLLNRQGWDEARRSARIRQNDILAEYGERLDDEGRFTRPGGALFQPPPTPGRAMLDRARASLKARGYGGEPIPLAAEKKNHPSFVLGPACPAACGRNEAAAPLVLVNPLRNRLDALTVPEPAEEQALTRGRLAFMGNEAQLRFSPGGVILAATEDTGAVHFFDARNQGRHLDAIQPQAGDTPELRLLALLADDLPPLALFYDQAEDRHLLAEAVSGRALRSRPLEPGTGIGLTAWAAAPAGHWAVGLSDGSLAFFSPDKPAPVILAAPSTTAWSALAFSGNGQTLAAGEGRTLHLFRSGRPGALKSTLAGTITRLALDQDGRWLWAALSLPRYAPDPATGEAQLPAGRSALALVDLSAPGQPLYQVTEGPILALGYNRGGALALTEAPPGEGGPTRAAARWARGRTDIWPFNLWRPAGLGLQGPDRLFAGLTPTELFHQERTPDRPYVTLGRESLASRRPGRLMTAGRQRLLSPAAFDLSGRLAVFPELDGGSFYVFNLAAGREIARGRSGDPEGLLGAAFLRNPSRLLTFGRGGLIRLWSLGGPEPGLLLTWAFTEGGRWAAVTPEGLFDTDDPEDLDHIHLHSGRGPALPLGRFAEESFRPGLSAAVLGPRPQAGGSEK